MNVSPCTSQYTIITFSPQHPVQLVKYYVNHSISDYCVVWERNQYCYMLDCHKLVLLCCTNCTESVSSHVLFVNFLWNVTLLVVSVTVIIIISYRGAFYIFLLHLVLQNFSLIVNVVQRLVLICIAVPLINLNE